ESHSTTKDPSAQPPTAKARRQRSQEKQRRKRASRRLDRTMRQIERSRTAGSCRRFAYPAAIVGLVDGLGRALRPAEGFFPESTAVVDAYTGLLDLSNGGVLGWF